VRTLLALALLLQLGATQDSGPAASPEHLRWQRAVQLPAGASGRACPVLDATVFAHAAGQADTLRTPGDLRLYSAGAETPFVVIESEPEAAEVESASVQNLGMRGGDVVFDLAMPSRAYTDVVLTLGGKNFVATAKVSAPDATGGEIGLGTFALFDLSKQGLSRSTTLPLQEATFAVLHVVLHVTAIDGSAYPGLTAQMVEGAEVPPSREAQTLYTPVAMTSNVVQKGKASEATFQIPAHVPVERVAFGIAPGFTKEFSREVEVSAQTAKKDDTQTTELISGEIWRITRNGAGGGPAIHQKKLSVNAEIASNLREPATVTNVVENGDDAPLQIQNVQLEMRQRTLCFDAAAGASYVLRYGDAALRAPVYDYARLYQPQASAIAAQLGPELANVDYHPRPDERPFTERHPELMWVALLLVVAVLGGTALHSVKGKKTDSRQ
jgi:hypothetical protein